MVFIKKLGLSAVPRLIESNRCDDKHCCAGAATTEAILVSGFSSFRGTAATTDEHRWTQILGQPRMDTNKAPKVRSDDSLGCKAQGRPEPGAHALRFRPAKS
jgi:hypothetical protein